MKLTDKSSWITIQYICVSFLTVCFIGLIASDIFVFFIGILFQLFIPAVIIACISFICSLRCNSKHKKILLVLNVVNILLFLFWLLNPSERCNADIAVTPLIYDFEVAMEDIDISQLYPMRYMRCYNLKNIPKFYQEELLLNIYTTRNVDQLPVIGNIDPSNIYQGDLSWNPEPGKFHLCGDPQNHLGREAYLSWLENH